LTWIKFAEYRCRTNQADPGVQLPQGVDAGKVEAGFKKGVPKMRLPKTLEAPQAVKKVGSFAEKKARGRGWLAPF
jgi:hypothetical protein